MQMKTQEQLQYRCTPEIIKKMVELAEGFDIKFILCFDDNSESRNRLVFNYNITDGVEIYDSLFFPLLIHRAVEGWNKHCDDKGVIIISDDFITYYGNNSERHYDFETYNIGENTQVAPIILTLAECAMLDCLLDVLEEK